MKMTKKDAEQIFRTEILPSVIEHYENDGIIDKPARAEAWNIFKDGLCKDGEITDYQYNNWLYPKFINNKNI